VGESLPSGDCVAAVNVTRRGVNDVRHMPAIDGYLEQVVAIPQDWVCPKLLELKYYTLCGILTFTLTQKIV
jgi:hypothetical protein